MAIRYVDVEPQKRERAPAKRRSEPVKKAGKRSASFDRNAYQRDYMRKRRAAKKAGAL